MKFTKYEIYGLQIVCYCAAHKGSIVNRVKMCRDENIPGHFSAKIAQDLARRGILKIHQGANGGLEYIGDDNLSFKDTIEALSGNINVILGMPDNNITGILYHLNETVKDFLDNIIIEEL